MNIFLNTTPDQPIDLPTVTRLQWIKFRKESVYKWLLWFICLLWIAFLVAVVNNPQPKPPTPPRVAPEKNPPGIFGWVFQASFSFLGFSIFLVSSFFSFKLLTLHTIFFHIRPHQYITKFLTIYNTLMARFFATNRNIWHFLFRWLKSWVKLFKLYILNELSQDFSIK